ncbi:MAG: prepilin-type N-terminal cleavage/methylation domain-containing protein [Gammaproteobacteria bacterium]
MVANIRKQQGGFTLVEIAIVLVIIGLLLGGILKGQELITSARVRNVADQNSGVQAAYYGFIDRYRMIPGDMQPGNGATQACSVLGASNLPNCANVGGDGNGRLSDGTDGGSAWGEAGAVWSHLAAAGFIQGPYATALLIGNAAAYQNTAVAPTNPWGGYLLLGRSNQYLAPAGQPIRLHLVLGRGMPVAVARELDVKVDDGLAESGVLRGAPSGGGTYAPVDNESATCVSGNSPNRIWAINANDNDCNAFYLY